MVQRHDAALDTFFLQLYFFLEQSLNNNVKSR
jgi:hypothetical protein